MEQPHAIEGKAMERTPVKADAEKQGAPAPRDPFLRPPNEDDDGYDPYSDRPYEEPRYEPDPWA